MYDDVAHGSWQWVSVTQASAILGLSPATIRRRIRDGVAIAVPNHPDMVLVAEREERPQGSSFLVRLPTGLAAPAEEDPSGDAPDASEQASAPAPALDVAELARGAVEAAVAPWVAHLARAQDALERRAEEIGALRARLELARADQAEAAQERDRWQREAARWEMVAREGQAEYTQVLAGAHREAQEARDRATVAEEALRALEVLTSPPVGTGGHRWLRWLPWHR
jgi:hypothetical protein